ncbi:unnamed protein product [Dicrocoelium dendriticum]|nr:unnamed protein product [Dicrocoelium dendriticum]
MLEPGLFLTFINDLAGEITSGCLFFADYIKFCPMIRKPNNHEKLQRDLNTISNWSVLNTLPFNVEYCHAAQLRQRHDYVHSFGSHVLQTSSQERGVGVLIQSELNCLKQTGSCEERQPARRLTVDSIRNFRPIHLPHEARVLGSTSSCIRYPTLANLAEARLRSTRETTR